MSDRDQKNFGEKINKDSSYKIIRADGVAHIALDKNTTTTGYVVFEANKDLESGVLKEVSEPALIMARQNDDNHITLSAVQPDLNFPEYELGKFRNYSMPVSLTLTLNGIWKTPTSSPVKTVTYSGNTTLITLECKDGFSNIIKINK